MRCVAKALLCAAVAAPCAVLAGCSESEPASPPGVATVKVIERDYHIGAPDRIDAGPVHLTIYNRGPDAHEFILLHSDGSKLPMRDDGITADEDAVEPLTVEALEPAPPGVRGFDADLAPGRYLMICNMTGHMLGGMRRELTVG